MPKNLSGTVPVCGRARVNHLQHRPVSGACCVALILGAAQVLVLVCIHYSTHWVSVSVLHRIVGSRCVAGCSCYASTLPLLPPVVRDNRSLLLVHVWERRWHKNLRLAHVSQGVPTQFPCGRDGDFRSV